MEPMRPSRGSACLRVRVRVELRSWTHSHQINHREYPDPNDVEGVPEQGEAEQAALHAGDESHHRHLDHHHHEPNQTEGDVQTVAADKREESRQESAALRRRAARYHICELAKLECKKRSAECERDKSTQIGAETISRIDGERH